MDSLGYKKVGLMSRRKGRRGEQQLVLYLAKLGFKAERILRQYQEAGEPDVLAEKNGEKTTFEIKLRNNSYKTIYELYNSEKDQNGVLRFVTSPGGILVELSTNLMDLKDQPDKSFRVLTAEPCSPKKLRTYIRIVKMIKMKQKADYLVLQDNRKPRLFIRYWV